MTQGKLRVKGVGTSNPVDADAQAFITAAGITDTTQKSAINTLVVNLKAYGIWTKMKAIYPMVGGTATTHKFNLKDPRDLDAAFRLVFNGGWVHSSTGAKPNGTNGYADTYYVPSVNLTDINSNHISYYSRTNATGGIEMGGGPIPLVDLVIKGGESMWNMASFAYYPPQTDSRNFLINTRTGANLFKFIKNGSVITTSTSAAGTTKPNVSYYLGKRNYPGGPWSTKECAFSSIGDGLTDAEATNFYTAVQAFQTTLGRSIGTQIVSDADAQAFVTNAGIVDQVEATAVNNLVIGLKADSIWTKMKALYPMVGGTASSHKFNLKDPRDLDVAFRLTFSGGITHTSNGVQGNGLNGYANTFIKPATNLLDNSSHISFYSRTNISSGAWDMGVAEDAKSYMTMELKTGTSFRPFAQDIDVSNISNLDSTGFYIANRTSSNQKSAFKNGNKVLTSNASSRVRTNFPIYLLAIYFAGNPYGYSTRQNSFASIGDGLTDAEATNFYNRVQTFQTALNRNV